MRPAFAFVLMTLAAGLLCGSADQSGGASSPPRAYAVRGIVLERKSDGFSAVIRHEEVANYMPAMTMSFKAGSTNELAGIQAGDEISFRLLVTGDRSWIDQVAKTGRREALTPPGAGIPPPDSGPAAVPASKRKSRSPLLDYKFTNELGAPVSFNDFRGQVIAYTFFFTRCPVPEYCPRLSRNFQEVSKKLEAMPNAPTNWRLISVSFDSEFDTPAILKAYAERYQYDSNHWTFLTGPKTQIGELARLSGAKFQPDSGLFNHDFRTLVVSPSGALQMSYPIGGDLSDAIVADILKASGATNLPPFK